MEQNDTTVEETTTTTDTEETVVDTTEQTEDTTEETLEERVERLEKENHTLKIQRGKAKAKAERAQEEASAATVEGDLSRTDLLALARADIHDEDIDDFILLCKAKELSMSEGLTDGDIQAVLDRRNENRTAAAATHTGSAASGKVEMTGDQLKDMARKNFANMTPEQVKKLASQ